VELTKPSLIEEVIEAVARALQDAGIEVILVGGACAAVYSRGSYRSGDLDLIMKSSPTQADVDRALAGIGFRRRLDDYFHAPSRYSIEFVRGPLSIGSDLRIQPTLMRVGRSRMPALSATDSCRDRLAHFFHWNDRQALDAAISIALNNPVNMARVRGWSTAEGMSEKFVQFQAAIGRERARLNRRKRNARKRRQSRRAG
jgi:hypothetical protein